MPPLAPLELSILTAQGPLGVIPRTLIDTFKEVSSQDRRFFGSVRDHEGTTTCVHDEDTMIAFARFVNVRHMEWADDDSAFPNALRSARNTYADVGVAVLPAYRDLGIATKMLEATIPLLPHGCTVLLRVHTNDVSHLRHLVRAGFKRTWECKRDGRELVCEIAEHVQSFPPNPPAGTHAIYLLGMTTPRPKHNSSCPPTLPSIPEE